jgi:AcrR family transcriptional regulator
MTLANSKPNPVTTRERLNIEAAKQFAQNGYHGTSIGDLAKALGIQKSAVYSHIDGKEDLLARIALAGAEAFHAALDAVPEDETPDTRLRLALAGHLSVVDQQLDVATVWLHEWRFLTGEPRARFLADRKRYEERVRALFEDAIAKGSLRGDLDLDYAALTFFSIGNWAYTWMTHTTDVDYATEQFAALLLDGARPR